MKYVNPSKTLNNYGTAENITVVFDGGNFLLSTKERGNIRRSKARLGRKIIPSLCNPLTVKKVDFLLNKHNKQAFIECLGPNCQLLVLV